MKASGAFKYMVRVRYLLLLLLPSEGIGVGIHRRDWVRRRVSVLSPGLSRDWAGWGWAGWGWAGWGVTPPGPLHTGLTNFQFMPTAGDHRTYCRHIVQKTVLQSLTL
jgi:hypothetical protein